MEADVAPEVPHRLEREQTAADDEFPAADGEPGGDLPVGCDPQRHALGDGAGARGDVEGVLGRYQRLQAERRAAACVGRRLRALRGQVRREADGYADQWR